MYFLLNILVRLPEKDGRTIHRNPSYKPKYFPLKLMKHPLEEIAEKEGDEEDCDRGILTLQLLRTHADGTYNQRRSAGTVKHVPLKWMTRQREEIAKEGKDEEYGAGSTFTSRPHCILGCETYKRRHSADCAKTDVYKTNSQLSANNGPVNHEPNTNTFNYYESTSYDSICRISKVKTFSLDDYSMQQRKEIDVDTKEQPLPLPPAIKEMADNMSSCTLNLDRLPPPPLLFCDIEDFCDYQLSLQPPSFEGYVLRAFNRTATSQQIEQTAQSNYCYISLRNNVTHYLPYESTFKNVTFRALQKQSVYSGKSMKDLEPACKEVELRTEDMNDQNAFITNQEFAGNNASFLDAIGDVSQLSLPHPPLKSQTLPVCDIENQLKAQQIEQSVQSGQSSYTSNCATVFPFSQYTFPSNNHSFRDWQPKYVYSEKDIYKRNVFSSNYNFEIKTKKINYGSPSIFEFAGSNAHSAATKKFVHANELPKCLGKPQPPIRNENTRLSTPKKVSDFICNPPKKFVENVQRAIRKNWQVALKCKPESTTSSNEVFGFREKTLFNNHKHNKDTNISKWLQTHYGGGSLGNPNPIGKRVPPVPPPRSDSLLKKL